MDDMVEIIAEGIDSIISVVSDAADDRAFDKAAKQKRSPLARFLLGLAGAAVVGLICWAAVTIFIL